MYIRVITKLPIFVLFDFYRRVLIDRDYQIYIFRNVSTIYVVILDAEG
jgi:hypothetical protein